MWRCDNIHRINSQHEVNAMQCQHKIWHALYTALIGPLSFGYSQGKVVHWEGQRCDGRVKDRQWSVARDVVTSALCTDRGYISRVVFFISGISLSSATRQIFSLTERGRKLPDTQAKVTKISRPVAAAWKIADKSTSKRARYWLAGRILTTLTEALPWFSSVLS
jgi:hypothetical protein